MIVVVFQVTMKAGKASEYFDLAGVLGETLAHVEGFLSVERFESVSEPGKYVSISFWRDEDAVDAWRANEGHRAAQALGKSEIFADFRISVASVIRDYTLADRLKRAGRR